MLHLIHFVQTNTNSIGNDGCACDPSIGNCILARNRLGLDQIDSRIRGLVDGEIGHITLLADVHVEQRSSVGSIVGVNGSFCSIIDSFEGILMDISYSCVEIVECGKHRIGLVTETVLKKCDVISTL